MIQFSQNPELQVVVYYFFLYWTSGREMLIQPQKHCSMEEQNWSLVPVPAG
jgi:hypothetical protein